MSWLSRSRSWGKNRFLGGSPLAWTYLPASSSLHQHGLSCRGIAYADKDRIILSTDSAGRLFLTFFSNPFGAEAPPPSPS